MKEKVSVNDIDRSHRLGKTHTDLGLQVVIYRAAWRTFKAQARKTKKSFP